MKENKIQVKEINVSQNEDYKHKIKCPRCGKTLFFANESDLEIKCNRCKSLIKVN